MHPAEETSSLMARSKLGSDHRMFATRTRTRRSAQTSASFCVLALVLGGAATVLIMSGQTRALRA